MEHGHVISVIGEHCDGTQCELIALPVAQVFPLDDGISFEDAAAFPLVYETAYRMLVTKAGVQEGEWALIWGIGGGVATGAFEICRALGVKTIVTSGSDEKLEQARGWGADVAVNHARATCRPRSRRRPAPGLDVVIETVGEATWARSLASGAAGRARRRLRRHERPEPTGGAAPLLVEAARRLRLLDGDASRLPRRLRPRRSGRARVHVDRVFPLAETRAAHERLEAGEQLGKIVIRIP